MEILPVVGPENVLESMRRQNAEQLCPCGRQPLELENPSPTERQPSHRQHEIVHDSDEGRRT